jgi:hypothetical protein
MARLCDQKGTEKIGTAKKSGKAENQAEIW